MPMLPMLPRYADMGPIERSKSKWHKVIMIVPPCYKDPTTGKRRTPPNMDGFLLPLLWDLKKYGPGPGVTDGGLLGGCG